MIQQKGYCPADIDFNCPAEMAEMAEIISDWNLEVVYYIHRIYK